MGRKLSKTEKTLILLLVAALIGAAYYYLYWVNATAKIETLKTEISGLQAVYNEYQKKVNGLGALREELEALKSQPSHKEDFFASNVTEETYMYFLQKLIDENDLWLESIVFSAGKADLPTAPPNPEAEAPVDQIDQIDAPKYYFNVTNATMSFYVDHETPEKLFNMLEAIENNKEMVLVGNMQISIGTGGMPGKELEPGMTVEKATAAKYFKCVAVISFVSLVDPYENLAPLDSGENMDNEPNVYDVLVD